MKVQRLSAKCNCHDCRNKTGDLWILAIVTTIVGLFMGFFAAFKD